MVKVVQVIQVYHVVIVVRVISVNDTPSEHIWFSWSKLSNYEEKLRCHAWEVKILFLLISLFFCFVFLHWSHQNSSRLHAVVCRKKRGAHLDPQTVSPYVLPSRMSEWRTHLSYLLSATLNHFLIHSNYTFSIESRRNCSSRPSMVNWRNSPIFPRLFVPQWWHLLLLFLLLLLFPILLLWPIFFLEMNWNGEVIGQIIFCYHDPLPPFVTGSKNCWPQKISNNGLK